jgi:hypothetical protein
MKTRHHIAGIPEFEFWTPDNPHIVQSEMLRFTDRTCDEETPIGHDCRGIDDRQPFEVRLLIRLDRADSRAAGFRNLRSLPPWMLDFANPDSEWVKSAHRRNQVARKRNGKSCRRPHGPDWQSNDKDYPLSFFDCLALGDARAGHILYLMEQESGSTRFE